MSYTKKAVWGMAVVFACIFFAHALAYLMRLVLARSLGVSDYGLLYAVFALFGFLAFAPSFGLSDALIQYLPSARSASKIKSAFVTVLYTQLALISFIVLVFLLLANTLAMSYFHDPNAYVLVVMYAIVFLVSPIEVLLIAVFQGTGRASWYGYATLLRAITLLLLTWWFMHKGWGVYGAMLPYLLVYLLIPLVYLPMLFSAVPGWHRAKAKFDVPLLKKLFAVGLPVMITGTIGIFLSYVDVVFITYYRSLAEVGLYNIAMPLAGVLWFFSGTIYSVMLPIVSEMYAKKRMRELGEGLGTMYVYLLVGVLPFATIMFVFPDVIINALFGAEYLAATNTLRILVIGGVLYAFYTLNSSVIVAIKKPKLLMWAMLVAAIINVVLDILLIPKFGIEGSAIATLCAFVYLFISTTILLCRSVRVRMWYARMCGALLAVVFFASVIFVLRTTLSLPLWWKIGVSLVVGGVVYVLAIFLLRVVTIDELLELKRRVLK